MSAFLDHPVHIYLNRAWQDTLDNFSLIATIFRKFLQCIFLQPQLQNIWFSAVYWQHYTVCVSETNSNGNVHKHLHIVILKALFHYKIGVLSPNNQVCCENECMIDCGQQFSCSLNKHRLQTAHSLFSALLVTTPSLTTQPNSVQIDSLQVMWATTRYTVSQKIRH